MNVRKPRPTTTVNHTANKKASENTDDLFYKFGWSVVWFAAFYLGLHMVIALFR